MRFFILGLLFRGVPFSAAGFLAAAWAFSMIDLPNGVLTLTAALPVMLGVWCFAFYTARRTRTHGLRWGILCALLLAGGWTLLSGICTEFGFPVCLLMSVPAGIWGGVLGVNYPAPAIRRRSHTVRRAVPRTVLRVTAAAAVCRTRKAASEVRRVDS